MAAQVGDRIIVASQKVGRAAREGEIIEASYGTRYRVRWDDGQESTIRPAAEQRPNDPTRGAATGRGARSASGTDPAQGRRTNAEGLHLTRNAFAGDSVFGGHDGTIVVARRVAGESFRQWVLPASDQITDSESRLRAGRPHPNSAATLEID